MKALAAVLLASVLVVSACDEKPLGCDLCVNNTTITIAPTVMNLAVGETKTIVASVTNDTVGAKAGAAWTSTKPAVASVDSITGAVTGVSAGTATIIASSRFRPAVQAASQVIVSAATSGEVKIAITPSVANMKVGDEITAVATVTNDTTGALTGVRWKSNLPFVVAIDSVTGAMKALTAGTATITATSRFRPTATATLTVGVTFRTAVVMPTLGEGVVSERYTAEVAVRGDYAYTTTWGNRGNLGDVVKIWNIASDVPTLVDSLKLTSTGTTSDVQISPDGGLLVVSTEQRSGGSIAIYDRTDPAHPTLISRYQTPLTTRGVHTVKMSVINGKLYGFLQIDPNPAALLIVDMSDPAHVQQVFTQPMGSPFVHDVFVRDGLLFAALWNDGMTIFDVGGGKLGGSPSNPVQIGNVKTQTGQIHNVWWLHDPITGSKKYAFLGEEGLGSVSPVATSSGDIHVIDVSNMSAPKEVAIYTLGSNVGTHNFWVDEQSGILYAAYYNGGVRAIDVRGDLSTCTSAQKTVSAGTPDTVLCDLRLMGREAGTALTGGQNYVWGVMMQGNRLYASDMGRGLIVLDVSALKR